MSLPGGCAIGNRPIDLHLKALEALGAEIEIAAGYVQRDRAGRRPQGRHDHLPDRLGRRDRERADGGGARAGETVIDNAAREPEIVDLCHCLVAMGAEIEGIGTERLMIHGEPGCTAPTYRVMPDRIEAGSYACAAAITGGDLELVGARASDMTRDPRRLREAGLHVETDGRRHPRRRERQAPAAHALDRALSGLRDRHAGAVHGDAGAGRRRQRADRDDLREPLHARARAGADGRRHPGARPHGGGARRRPAGRRAR